MTRLTATSAALLATTALVLFSNTASADCVQPPFSVPGLTGPPVWFPPAGGAPWRSELQDPRWAGGPMHSFSVRNGGTPQDQFDAQYRLVYSGNSLYVSIQVLADPGGIDGLDAVYFGITGGTASLGAYLLEIPPDALHPQSTCSVTHDPACPIPNNPGLANYYMTPNRSLASPTWTGVGTTPPWLTNVAAWTNSPGVAWAVTLQVDTTSLTVGAMQMFFGARINMSGGTTVLLTSSSQPTVTNPQIGDTPSGVSIADWVNYDALGSACPTGITTSSNSIGVWNGSSLSTSLATCPGGTCTNKFRVELQNVPAAGSAPFAVRTRVRLADWGVPNPDAPWNDVGIAPDVFVRPQAAFTSPPWTWTQSGSTVDIDYTCSLDGVAGHGYCPWEASGQPQQCVLVELAVSPGAVGTPGWVIQTPAVYRCPTATTADGGVDGSVGAEAGADADTDVGSDGQTDAGASRDSGANADGSVAQDSAAINLADSGTSDATLSGHACIPGQSVACVGVGGCAGGQACNDQGTGFGACLCGLVVGDGGNQPGTAGDGSSQPPSGVADGGSGVPATQQSGCSCGSAQTAAQGSGLWALTLIGSMLWRRRRSTERG